MIANTDGGVEGSLQVSSTRLLTPIREDFDSEAMQTALDRGREWLLDRQDPSGFWVGELEGDTILESEYILLMAYLGREGEEICRKLGRYLLEQARSDGGWAIYPEGPFDLSASVKGYFALKLVGVSVDDPFMRVTRELIIESGGAHACNSFTRFYLALLGQIDYDECPSVPPELVLLPRWIGLNLHAMSAWTRTILVPLTIISAFKPRREFSAERGIAELFVEPTGVGASRGFRIPRPSWKGAFVLLDRVFKLIDRWAPSSWRKPGIAAAHRWMLDHFENSDGLGAIFPPMVYSVVALDCLGYAADSPVMQWALDRLSDLCIEENDSVRVQPCVSPIWDTAITMIAAADAGLPTYHPSLLRAARWLLEREVRRGGDWTARLPRIEPGGWHFQFQNERYPDVDDTAMVLLALSRTSIARETEVREATRRGVDWLLAMQNRDGGWAAFDVDITNQILTKVPFADHNAMLDPSCADITARVIELLGQLGRRSDHPAIARALQYLFSSQEPEGCWYGRWGVNYIYGTWQVLQGLAAIGHPVTDPAVERAADWLESVQQECGGWGESCLSYDDPSWMGKGNPTASQTAWAVLGLIAAGRSGSESVRTGIDYLIETQRADGSWDEPEFTGTGFPRVFYLKYHLYRINFPLMALARYRAAAGIGRDASSTASAAPAGRITAAAPRSLEV